MSQQVKVERDLVFRGSAEVTPNVKGNMLPEKMSSVDWFDQTTLDTTNDYTDTSNGTGASSALTAGGYNGVTFTTGTDDNAIGFLATGLIFDINQNPIIESKIKIVDVSGSVLFFGFSDATSETTPDATIDYADGTLAAAATDAVGFVVDADKGSSSIYCASIATGGSVTATDSGIAWTDNQSKTLRVALDSSGNARFYVDGVAVHYEASAVTDVPLCAIYNYGNRDGNSDTIYARYLAKFQDIP